MSDKTVTGKKTRKGDKYSKGATWLDPSVKLRPSDLALASVNVSADDYPMIEKFNNIQDNSAHVHSTVDVDQPLFQPSVKVIVFEDYAPFAVHEKKVYFRNNDSVARRIKILQPQTPFFEVSAARGPNGEPLQQSKVAPGMEVCFIMKFKPQDVRDYEWDLICSTEREQFIVPIRAIGNRPRLTFPDDIQFGLCPLKSTTRKMLLIQNVGSCVANFSMKSNNSVFECPEEAMVVEPGASKLIEIFFTPPQARLSQAEFEVEFVRGVKCYISVTGTGKNVDVSLSTPTLALEGTYISLVSQKTLRIRNHSDIPIKFCWKSFAMVDEEEQERERLLQEINRMESIEYVALRDGLYNSAEGVNMDLDYGDDDDEEDSNVDNIPFEGRAALATLKRKYRNLRLALQNDNMSFVDNIFDVTPLEGQVWANSEIEVTVSFHPDTAAQYICMAYLDISGREDRLPLHLTGQGIGPRATLSFDVLDVGDVFVNSEQYYDLKMTNKGDIPTQWTFLSSLTKFGNKFSFYPREGYLKTGESTNVQIRFESDILGEFSEHFRFALQGNEDLLVCQIKGHVIGPTFHFDYKSLEFGIVSFDCLNSRTIRLVNTSKISMVYHLHVPQDGTLMKKEFDISPCDGTLGPGDSQDIAVEFIPNTAKVYKYSLAVDVLGVGDSLFILPITAECIVSNLKLDNRDIHFNDCFIRYPYEQTLTVVNMSNVVCTKFEVLPQLQYTKNIATFEAEPSIGVVEPNDSMTVKIRLIAEKLGPFKMPVVIAVTGSQDAPIQATLFCTAIGPRVLADKTELRWGNIECLKDSERTFKITNDSLVPASLKVFLKLARSKFSMNVREIVLEAQESTDVDVIVNLDDCIVQRDELHIVVAEGNNLMIPLSAKGIGTTIHCADDLEKIDLGVQLTTVVFRKHMVLENKGRRPQQLHWYNKTVRDENNIRAVGAKKLLKDTPGARLPKHLANLESSIKVEPEEITLRPRTATTFTFSGGSSTAGTINEVFVLESRVGKERVMKEIIQTEVLCEVVDPLLEFSERELNYSYFWKPEGGVDIKAADVSQTKTITLTNKSAITLEFLMKVELPFNLSSWEHGLKPGQSVDVTVEFDPLYQNGKTSHLVEKQLLITYSGHPQKDAVVLKGDINFPNLSFETTTIKFGCILNDTSKTIRVKATNWSKVAAKYEWVFMENDPPKMNKGQKSKHPAQIPASQIFDILPTNSLLMPGESEEVEFTMFGNANKKAVATALCAVEGGPDYKCILSGEGSTVSYALDKSFINFDKVIYSERKDDDFVIHNNGKVSFSFEISTELLTSPGLIEVIPSSGKVQPGEKLKILLRIRPGVPANIAEALAINIAHFDPIKLMCYCQGTFPAVAVTLPRSRKTGPYGQTEGDLHQLWEDFLAEATANITDIDPASIPPTADAALPPATGTTAVPPVYIPPLPPMEASWSTGMLDGGDSMASSFRGPDEASVAGRTSKGEGPNGAPSQIQMEVEMHRMAFCHHIHNQIESMRQSSADPSSLSPRKGLQNIVQKFVDVQNVVVGHYLCDFGNVISGQSKKRVFKVVNASSAGPISWVFDKRNLTAMGYTLEPEKVTKLPELATIDFTLKFVARSKLKLGRKTVILPIEIKGAPTINLVITANVCLPEVDVSSDLIDFDRVFIGCSKRIFMRITNTSPVTANWNFRRNEGKDESKINFTPNSGSIRTGRKTVVCIEFVPSEARKYNLEMNLRLENNAKMKVIKVVGEGVGTPIRFDPPVVELGPSFPFSLGEERTVTMSNLSDVPIEVFSLDFDQSYKQEDTVLTAIGDSYDGDGIFRTALRKAGDPLPNEIQVAYKNFIAIQNGEESLTQLKDAPIRTDEGPRDLDKHQDIFVIGPPLSGTSTMSKLMSKKLVLTSKTVDELLEEVTECSGEIPARARAVLGLLTDQEKVGFEETKGRLKREADESKEKAMEEYQKSKKKAKEVPEEIYQTEQVAAYNKFTKDNTMDAQCLCDILKYRLTWVDAAYGMIICGFSDKYAPYPVIFNGLFKAMPKLIVSLLNFNGGDEMYAERIAGIYEHNSILLTKLSEDVTRLYKSYERLYKINQKKASLTGSVSPRGKKGDRTAGPMEIPLEIPNGDESWVDQVTGLVIDLEGQDFKALEEDQKVLYYAQMYNQCQSQVVEIEEVLRKILLFWSPESGLRTEHVENEPTSQSVVIDHDEAVSNAESGDASGGASGDSVAAESAGDGSQPPVGSEEGSVAEGSVASKPTTPAVPVVKQKIVLYNEFMDGILPVLKTSALASEKLLGGKPETAAPEATEPAPAEGKSKPTTAKSKPGTAVSKDAVPGTAPGTAGVAGSAPGTAADTGEVTPMGDSLSRALSIDSLAVEKDYGLFDIVLDGHEIEAEVFNSIMALLPPPKVGLADKDAVPSSKNYQVFRKPYARIDRKRVNGFVILGMETPVDEPAVAEDPKAKKGEAPKAAVVPYGSAQTVAGKIEEDATYIAATQPQYRWIIPAGGDVQFRVRFKVQHEGKFDANLGFEVMGTKQDFNLFCSGLSEIPKINMDPRNIFMRRVKGYPNMVLPQRRYVSSEDYFSFGPLLTFKQADWRLIPEKSESEEDEKLQLVQTTNADVLRISNNGRYKAQVDMSYASPASEDASGVFFVDPPTMELEEGETKEIKVWAFPRKSIDYESTLVICTSNNPLSLKFPMKCCGVDPTIECDGPWTEAIAKVQAELDNTTEKPGSKPYKEIQDRLAQANEFLTLDFDRLLLGKVETRSFTIKNSCLLPVSWEIDPDEFADSPNVSIIPTSGVLQVGQSTTIVVSFSSPTALVLPGGKFFLKYSDGEGGLQAPARVLTKKFLLKAEAYFIKAVTLTAEGSDEKGNEVDFGLMRVGDYATQSIKIGNNGKFKIGFKLSVKRPAMAQLIKIEPEEGIIEPGTNVVDIKLTFCDTAGELNLVGNKDVHVLISEPETGELVEEFPLFISAETRYNKFRMQPGKGIAFGAVRFDSDAKSKNVELRNEGAFDIAYVVTPVQAEHDEIDTLDDASFAAYTFSTPPALRKAQLGENYLERVAKGGGKAAPPPKKDAKKGAAVEADPTKNLLIFDPDNMNAMPIPENPLTIGAFNVSPRMAVIQPGQRISIDIKFDPSGCNTARERLRFCITGVDANDAPSLLLKSFEVTGESCFPAIVDNDVHNIFEEQEIVHSLGDLSGANDPNSGSDSSGKFEKLPFGKVVYAETEKMLAFGPVLCGQPNTKGTAERIKISNPTKIDTRVKFRMANPADAATWLAAAKAKAGAPGSAAGGKAPPPKKDDKKKDAKGGAEDSAVVPSFSVHPESWDIPPHEFRFVNVYFNPTEIKSYTGVFIAEVDDEGSTATVTLSKPQTGKYLTFDVAGSGTMPCIAIDCPTERDADGVLMVNFGKVHVNRKITKKFVIHNNGVIPATCLFNMEGDSDFLFSSRDASVSIEPGTTSTLTLQFAPKPDANNSANTAGTEKTASIKMSVLNNQFDQYLVKLQGLSYSCDAMIDTTVVGEKDMATVDLFGDGADAESKDEEEEDAALGDVIKVPAVNVSEGPGVASQTFTIKSQSNYPVKYDLSVVAGGTPEVPADLLSFSPRLGHLGPKATKEITVTFSPTVPIKIDTTKIACSLNRIEYKVKPDTDPESEENFAEKAFHGTWDNSMKSVRPASEADLAVIAKFEEEMADYKRRDEEEKAKGKKAKPIGPPPAACLLEIVGESPQTGTKMISETIGEPYHEMVEGAEAQTLNATIVASADTVKYKCDGHGENITFVPTFMFQSTVHKFSFTNDSTIPLPVTWSFDDIKRRATTMGSRAGTAAGSRAATAAAAVSNIPPPFLIEPKDAVVAPNSSKEFSVTFAPYDADEFIYLLKGETLPTAPVELAEGEEAPITPAQGNGPVRIILRGTAKRPLCHFDIKETMDYLIRRAPNMKNEIGLFSPIETADLKVVEMESTGLRSRNTFRFHVINPTNDNYEFQWEAVGDPSPFWRCVYSAGMLFAGKRAEMVFEYLPEEVVVAEAFFKFKLPNAGLEQLFLFAGSVVEPRVAFSVAKIDYHNVMLGGEGSNELIYLENDNHLPFNFQFDKTCLLQLEGPNGPVLDISPKAGMIAPHSKLPISFLFKPQEEIIYNFNLVCEVKRKPNKLSLNVKGEGYAVHPIIQLEQNEEAIINLANRFVTLRPAPAVNYADFGSVQCLDTVAKKITVVNNGRYNFDYLWDTESIGNMLALSGGKFGGTLHKGEMATYSLTFAPTREQSLDGCMLSFTVAGKYVYNIFCRGSGVKPAIHFSFMQYEFGPCFVTSPGGTTVFETVNLRVINRDPSNNISIECAFQKTRALWIECPPTVLAPGSVFDVPIKFSPRDVKDYNFICPFIVNGTGKVNLQLSGQGITARLEMVNSSQRRINFGAINVNGENRKSVTLVNRSKKALAVQLLDEGQYGAGILEDRCVSYSPKTEFVIGARDTTTIQVIFSPNRRISQFVEDLLVRYAGITRKLLSVSGKSQGMEVQLDTDSLPFGTVVVQSQKIKKLSLENMGDLPLSFHWMEGTFGPHFSITPLVGKLAPGNEISFDVIFKPKFVDEDIRQENIMLAIPGISPLLLTCSGMCISQPDESVKVLEFNSVARKASVLNVKLSNDTDKDWFISPSLQGDHWQVPYEFKIGPKSSADLPVTYFPLTMSDNKAANKGAEGDTHEGQLFLALPDGSAQLYKLRGTAGAPECSGQLECETAAKTAKAVVVKLTNWLAETQKFDVTVDIVEKPSPATFIVVSNAVEVGPSGTKDFQVRFNSYVEGNTKARITFTNSQTKEYCFYELNAKALAAEVIDVIKMESPVRQTARYVITAENPLKTVDAITMGAATKPDEDWWSCDSKCIRVEELSKFGGNTEGSFQIEYRPLLPTQQPTEHLLTIRSVELGTFKYKIICTAQPQSARQKLRFEVPLGTVQTESFVFKAYNSAKLDFACTVQRADVFTVAKSITSDAVTDWAGEDLKLPVSYEPMELGETRDLLTVSSADGGEYSCDITAICIAPMPQGPYNTPHGKPFEISFRNCFSASCTWNFAVDSKAFRVDKPNATVNAKTQGACSVIFDPSAEFLNAPNGIITAKLFVTCGGRPEVPPWVYYLRGKIDKEMAAAAEAKAAKGKK